jgi:hypothetical protein
MKVSRVNGREKLHWTVRKWSPGDLLGKPTRGVHDKVKGQGHRCRLHELLESGTLLRFWRHTCHRPTKSPPCWPARPLPTCSPGRCLAHQLPPITGGPQHHQTLAPNLPRRCRQTGLNAKGVTSELLRLKFYYSWTGDCFFFFLFFKCLFV